MTKLVLWIFNRIYIFFYVNFEEKVLNYIMDTIK